jgi:hypothetical protein
VQKVLISSLIVILMAGTISMVLPSVHAEVYLWYSMAHIKRNHED